MSKQARVRQHRRDRRKAKESGWRREPKRKMNGAVGHGGSGSNIIQSNEPVKSNGKIVKDKVIRTTGNAEPPTLMSRVWEGKDELMGIWQNLQERAIEDYNEAFDQGFFAYWHDIPSHENPYGSLEHGHPRFEEQFKAWRKGWNAAEKEVMHGNKNEEPIA